MIIDEDDVHPEHSSADGIASYAMAHESQQTLTRGKGDNGKGKRGKGGRGRSAMWEAATLIGNDAREHG